MTTLKCLLLDDELPGLTYLKMLCEQLPGVEVVKAFNDPQKLLGEAASLEFDLCILDIEMPGINGLQVANILKGVPVIFTTAYKEFAAEAFDLNAVDYIRKPVTRERLETAIQKAQQRIEKNLTPRSFIQINTDKGKAILFFDQIEYIYTSPSDSRDKKAVLQNGSELTLKNISFDRLNDILPEDRFCRINKAELIAIRNVQFFSHDQITSALLRNGKPLIFTLSPAFRNDFLQKVRL